MSWPADPAVLTQVAEAVRELPSPTVVLSEHLLPVTSRGIVAARLDEVRDLDPFRAVVLVAEDAADLRRVVSGLGGLKRVRFVSCVVVRHDRALTLRPCPDWPGLASIGASTVAGGAVTRVELVAPVAADEVLVAFARAAAPGSATGAQGVRVVVADERSLPPVDVTVRRTLDPAARCPPDAVLGSGHGPAQETSQQTSLVTGRAPTLVHDRDGLAVGPLDEAVFNPRGFPRTWSRPVVDLPAGARLTTTLVADLRSAQGVRLTWPVDERLVAGLAMCGVPLVCDAPPARARARLGEVLGDLLAEPADLDDALRREERSVRLRRAALVEHGTTAWRGRIAAEAGVRGPALPSVSLLLATRRPEQLGWALAQVSRQRLDGLGAAGAGLEVVLATHGFEPDRGEVADRLEGLSHVVVPVAAEAVLGEVLRAATDAAGGEVVMKIDDDDWYGPDVVADLLLTRRYSGADLVGMPAELVYLEDRDVTVRRRGPSENYGTFVAGGTLMIERAALRGLGGFAPLRVREDARLFADVLRAGGTIYRAQGLGYVLRRRAGGHTWNPGDDYFLRPESLTGRWDGFHPSRLLEADR